MQVWELEYTSLKHDACMSLYKVGVGEIKDLGTVRKKNINSTE